MLTVEIIDQIAAGLRETIGATAEADMLNEARVALDCILSRLGTVDVDVRAHAHAAGVGRLRQVVDEGTDLSKVVFDECDPLHDAWLLIAPAHLLRGMVHASTCKRKRGTIITGTMSSEDLRGLFGEPEGDGS